MVDKASRKITLVCTVGGSHQPIVTAIQALKPERVVFFCTGTDPATRKPGSRSQIEGKGLVIKARPEDEKPTLPAIPMLCGLADGQWEIVEVPADELDEAYVRMRRILVRLADESERVVADYTGGTKTMTAALVLAALDDGRVELQSVTGARSDLIKVRDGSQSAVPATVERIRFRHDVRPVLAAWRRFAWDESARGLDALGPPRHPGLRAAWLRARDVSRALAAWDRFDHARALDLLQPYESVVAQALPAHYPVLKRLADPNHSTSAGLRLWDLWLNAQRRAVDGRYDDAVARIYRLIEWTVQWQLEIKKGWRTADLPKEVAEAAGITPNRDGLYQAGLYAAWQLAAVHCGGPLAAFFGREREAMLDHLRRRNNSIIAHGTVPVSEQDWQVWEAWLIAEFEPLLRTLLAEANIRNPFPQLPQVYPWLEELDG